MRSFFKSPLFRKVRKGKVTADINDKSDPTSPPPPLPPKPGVCRCTITKEGRNLVICIDGTANQFGEMNTNVIELYSMLEKGSKRKQLTWYNSGIGTYARPSFISPAFYLQVLGHLIDLAIAWNFERTILAAYEWLAENYEEGDCIYLFGFSRGSFQVRVLSSMIDKCLRAILRSGNRQPSRAKTSTGSSTPAPKTSLSKRFNKLLRRHKKPEVDVDLSNKISMAQHFKNTFSQPDVHVHFVGAWDTVSSIGVVRGKKMLPHTVDGMEHVCYFRHALALDERRVKFLPEYAHGGYSLPKTPPRDTSKSSSLGGGLPSPENSTQSPSDARPQTLEVWFAGTHSDIGGGNTANPDMNRSRPPLRWMVYEARTLGLRTRLFDRELMENEKIEFKESLTGIWKLFEILPWRRLTFSTREDGKEVTYKPHLGTPRKIQPSVVQGLETYRPKARPPQGVSELWEDLRLRRDHTMWEEDDADAYVKPYVRKFVKDRSEDAWETVNTMVASGDGLQAVYEEVMRFLKSETEDYKADPDDKLRLLSRAEHLFSTKTLRLRDASELQDVIFQISETANSTNQEVAWRIFCNFLTYSNKFTVPYPFFQFCMQRFLDSKTEADFNFLEKIDTNIDNAWDPLHSSIVQQLLGNDDRGQWILDRSKDILDNHPIGIQTLDGEKERLSSFLKSGSAEYKKAVWSFLDRFTNVQRLKLEGHTRSVLAVAYSPDGTKIASASWDNTIRLWDALTGTQIGQPLLSHTGAVNCVAFSPDGAHIVSGSDDSTLRIWSVATGKLNGGVLEGHTDWIWSVAFSPDGRCIVSGSGDKTLRIWDAVTGRQIGRPLEGHTGSVRSAAYSPDGRSIVSGSGDKTVRIWDTETQQQIGEPLEGHEGPVTSVAFSPDGRRIVSGLLDRTIRLWDSSTRKQIGPALNGHEAWVKSVAFSPDGRYLVSGSYDWTIRIWDTSTGRQIGKSLLGHSGLVLSVAFSPDGTHVVSGSGDGTVRVGDASLKLWDVAD